MKAIQMNSFGGPEVLELTDLPEPEAGPDETIVRVTRAGVNFADTHVTQNVYLAKHELPVIPGAEVVGVTPDGRRVAAMLDVGGYAEAVAVPDADLIPIPDQVSDDQAAALLLQGLTARTILKVSANIQPGESVVVAAAAGGTGSLAVQLARHFGAGHVIALSSNAEKRELAMRLGADAAADSMTKDLTAAIIEANGGEMVDIVLESVGGEAFEQSLRALAPFGRLVIYGITTREQNHPRTGHLLKHSRAVVGFWMKHLRERPDLIRDGLEDVMGAAAEGRLEAVIGGTYGLSEARQAHEDLKARRTSGKLLIDPTR